MSVVKSVHMNHGGEALMTPDMRRHHHDQSSLLPLKLSSNNPSAATSADGDSKCEICGAPANFVCSACKGAHYCTSTCQVIFSNCFSKGD